MQSFVIDLGVECEDVVSGFVGVTTGRVEYISGCRQYLLTPKVDTQGSKRDAVWFDEDRLKQNTRAKKIDLPQRNDGPDVPAPAKG
ncbi:MAG: hypothetical protein R3B95_11425 [Nitrospirales bacterium]|nr:hypothetical protein [Nitrospirales bacterium]